MSEIAVRLIKLLTFIAVVAAFGNAFVLLVLHPFGLARQALVAATGGAAGWTRETFLPLLIAIVAIRTAVEALALQREPIRLAQDALSLR